MIEQIIAYINMALETISIIFITYVFFHLVHTDQKVQLSTVAEKFEKFKRYDLFKRSMIYLVLSLYGMFFAKISVYFKLPELAFLIFTLVGNIFLLLFVFRLFQLLKKYVTKTA